jgi:hypothetical protein
MNQQKQPPNKLKISIFSAVIFLIIASPTMYTLTSSLFGQAIATNGCPTLTGLVLHAVVFGIIIYASMFVHWQSYFTM